MHKSLLLVLCIVLFSAVNGQSSNPFMNDATGRPLYLVTNYRMDGSPYFSENYQLADIEAASGKTYYNVRVKINLAENQVLYLDDAQHEMVTTLPVTRVKLYNCVNEEGYIGNVTLAGYPDALNKTGALIFQVIDSGKISLLKNIKVTYNDAKKYGDADITRTFTQTESYYALVPGKGLKKIEKGKEAIIELFPDKRKELVSYIEQANLKCRTPKEFAMVFQCYNALK